jgi:anhydro-N-acetylmuramic acid kinase
MKTSFNRFTLSMNKKLQAVLKKKTRRIIGLLSGTSVDSIDAVLVRVSGSGVSTKLKVDDFSTLAIPQKVKLTIFRNSDRATAKIDEITRLNVIVGALFADAALKIMRRNKINATGVDLIGSHGQTIHHLPETREYAGFRVKSTLQIGDPSVIANLTGVTTVGDFRVADCAVGGDGAPLVPFLDHIMFTHKKLNRILLNIGGISNITVLPKAAVKKKIFAFDTGPGNMIIDGLMYHLFKKSYDKNGLSAKKGVVDPGLFTFLLDDSYYKSKPPKSTGRELYGIGFQKKILKRAAGMSKYDILRTVTEFTAYSIWFNYKQFVESTVHVDELIVSGGGALNPVIMRSLKNYFNGAKVRKASDFGINTRNKEAILFAILANECIEGNSANMPAVTGSGREVILGKICQG